MINSFFDHETRLIFEGYKSRKFPPELQRQMRKKLRYIDAANDLNDLKRPPGNRLEKLADDRDGQYSIRINKQWRICFEWDNGAYDVEINKHYER